jgi:hypothetical protein
MCRMQSQQKALKAPPLINTSTIAQVTFFFSFDAFMYVCMYVSSWNWEEYKNYEVA